MAAGVRLEGGRELRRALKRAGADIKDLKAINLSAAQIAREASAQLAPVRSGTLAATIRAAGTQTAGILRAGRAKVPYAGPIHWGWGKRNIEPQPFLSQGAQDSEGRWLPLYEQQLENLVDQVIKETNQ